MCLNLLRALAGTPLACSVSDPASLDRLRVLQAAGLVDARIPRPRGDGTVRVQDPAAVFAITPRGWKAIDAHAVVDTLPPNWLGRSRPASGG